MSQQNTYKKSKVVLDHIKHMEGVDRMDHFITFNQFKPQIKNGAEKGFFGYLRI